MRRLDGRTDGRSVDNRASFRRGLQCSSAFQHALADGRFSPGRVILCRALFFFYLNMLCHTVRDLSTATPAFDVRSSGLFCSRPGGLELVTRLSARSVTFL